MKEKKLILLSLTIPILYGLLVLFDRFLEYYFRFSKEYRFIYSYGSSIILNVQLIIILFSFGLGIYIIANLKKFTRTTIIISLFFGLSLFLYFIIMILLVVLKKDV